MAQQNDRYILTRAGYEQLQRELADYQARRARQQEEIGDIQNDGSENFPEEGAEFEARTMREFLDERIGNLTLILRNADVVDQDPDPRTVDPGDRVTVWSVEEGEEYEYDLIGGAEVMYGRLGVSIDSPVGNALLGRKIGDMVNVETPEGITRYVIRAITRTPR